MSGHDSVELEKQARELLMRCLHDVGGEASAGDLIERLIHENTSLSADTIKAAIWSLANQGLVEVDWRSEVRKAASAL